MKNLRWMLAVLLLIVPVAVRTLWFYRGTYQPASPVSTPAYAQFVRPQSILSTPAAQPVVAITGPSPLVVFDQAHANLYLYSEIEPLTRSLSALGTRIVLSDGTTSTLPDLLKTASAYVVINPTLPFLPADLTTINRFVDRGGHLLVITDPTRSMSGTTSPAAGASTSSVTPIDTANLLLTPFGLSFADDYLYNLTENESNFRNLILRDIQANALTGHAKEVIFFAAHSLKTAPKPLISASKGTFSSLTDAGSDFSVAATDKNERVLALGDLNFLTTPYVQVADNQLLVQGIADFLTNSQRVVDLTNFPYIFTRPVTLLTSEEKISDRNLVSALTSMQRLLDNQRVQVHLKSVPEKDNDLVVASLYSQYKDLETYLQSFKLKFDITSTETPASLPGTPVPTSGPATPTPTPFPAFGGGQAGGGIGGPGGFGGFGQPEAPKDSVMVPDFGKLATSGMGLVLLDMRPDRTTLVVLAETSIELSELATLLNTSGLSTCTVQGNIAMCPLTPSGPLG